MDQNLRNAFGLSRLQQVSLKLYIWVVSCRVDWYGLEHGDSNDSNLKWQGALEACSCYAKGESFVAQKPGLVGESASVVPDRKVAARNALPSRQS